MHSHFTKLPHTCWSRVTSLRLKRAKGQLYWICGSFGVFCFRYCTLTFTDLYSYATQNYILAHLFQPCQGPVFRKVQSDYSQTIWTFKSSMIGHLNKWLCVSRPCTKLSHFSFTHFCNFSMHVDNQWYFNVSLNSQNISYSSGNSKDSWLCALSYLLSLHRQPTANCKNAAPELLQGQTESLLTLDRKCTYAMFSPFPVGFISSNLLSLVIFSLCRQSLTS